MRRRTPLYALVLIGIWVAALSISNLACICTGLRKPTPTPTKLLVAPTREPTATRPAPTKTHTRVPTSTSTTRPTRTKESPIVLPTRTPAPKEDTPTATPEPLVLVDPNVEDLPSTFEALPEGAEFELTATEGYVNALALKYLDDAPNLPFEIMDLTVEFVPDQIQGTAIIPFGFLRVEVGVKALWRAKDCKFEAEILEVSIGGQPAPATLREQVDPLLKDALEASTQIQACFTGVEIAEGKLTIRGYKD